MKKVLWKTFIALLFFLSAKTFSLFADDWVLAAQKFNLPQQNDSSSSLDGVATLLPQLILEQIVTGGERVPSSREMLNRKTEELLNERISLFSKLSAEIKRRDSIFFNTSDPDERKKNYEEVQVEIQSYQNQLKENLEKKEELLLLYKDAIEKEENPESYSTEADESDNKKNFNLFSIFEKKDENKLEIPPAEKIVLYKNDSYALFSPTQNSIDAGIGSMEYAKEISSQKIKGLLVGSIVKYGDYIAVTSEVFMFPGAVSLGSMTEVGTVADCVQISESIASYFSPKIYTNMPVDVFIELEPPEAKAAAKIAVDGYVYSVFPERLRLRSGIHTIEVESKNYNKQTIVWNFKDTSSFLVHVSLTEKNNGELNLSMLMPYAGSYLVNGVFCSDNEPLSFSTKVTVNGQPALGYFMTEDDAVKKVRKEIVDEDGNKKKVTEFENNGKIGAFFYIPEALMVPDSSIAVNLKPVDNVLEIDKRRIMMYRGYSALICSLPLSFIVSGRADARRNANLEKGLLAWTIAKYASIGVSVAAGGFFIYELIKYLKTAENVIPQNAREFKPGEKEKLEVLYAEYRAKKAEEEAEKAAAVAENKESSEQSMESEQEELSEIPEPAELSEQTETSEKSTEVNENIDNNTSGE